MVRGFKPFCTPESLRMVMRTYVFLLGLCLLAAPQLWAQRLSGEGSCTRPDTAHTVPVGDRPDHVFVVSKATCAWTRPFEIAGTRAKGGTAVQFDEMNGNASRFHGYYVDVMESGDTARYRYQGTSRFKDGKPQTAEWSWSFAGGSGKLRNLSGRGSCKGGWDREGVNRWRCGGEYRLSR
jgi:hypothetical protein